MTGLILNQADIQPKGGNMATSAIDKVNDTKKKHKIIENLPEGVRWAPEGGSMVVSTPKEVYSIISAIPEGRLLTISAIREYLARKYGTDVACPVSTGIFINITARAADELRAENKDFPPYWRVLRADGSLNPKYPNGTAEQQTLLEAEGFTIRTVRKTIFVEDYEDSIWQIEV